MGRVLLISDDDFVIDDTARMLEDMGWKVCIVTSRENALVTYLARPPSLTIIDVEMRAGAGFETIAQIRRNAKSLFILGISRCGDDESLLEIAKGYGADLCLPGPVSVADLSEAIEAGLSGSFQKPGPQ